MAGLNRRRKQRAQAEAALQYGPQEDNLALALQDARDTRDTTIRGARGTAAAQISAALHASPALRHALAGPTSHIDESYNTTLAHDLAALPGNGGTTAGGAARDAAAAKGVLAEILGTGLAENIARARDAKAGRAFAVSNARNQFATARSRIRAQQGSLARQKGLYTTTQYDSLSDSAATRANARARTREQARHDRAQEGISQQNADTAAAKAKAKAEAKAHPKASGTAVDKAQAAFNAALNDVNRIKAARGAGSRPYAKQVLASGRPSQTLKNGPDGQPLPNPVTVPGVKQVKSQAIAAAAMDMAYRGFVSQNTIKMLAAIGIKPQQLGLRTTPKVAAPLPRPPRLPSGTGALAPGTGGLGGFPAPRLH
jgi:hypothetical protein